MPRRLERKALIHHLKVVNRNTRRLFGYLGNATTEGVLLLCPRAVRADVDYSLEMMLPCDVDGSALITFTANNVWCRKDDQLRMFAAGFRISRMGSRDRQRMVKTIATFESRA
jgi:hypothetical protein